MPSSRRRRRQGSQANEPVDLHRALGGMHRVETKRDGLWNLYTQPAAAAVKTYLCPGCGHDVGENLAHVVAWRADGILGEADDLAGRRHWHSHCWRIRP